MVKIICDSTAVTTAELAQKYGVTTVPLNIHFGSETYRDKIHLTVGQSIDALVGLIKAIPKLEGLVIEDATTPDELEILADRLSEVYSKEKMYRTRVSPVIGVHVGPHVLAVLALGGK